MEAFKNENEQNILEIKVNNDINQIIENIPNLGKDLRKVIRK
jgi:hypothetical protein